MNNWWTPGGGFDEFEEVRMPTHYYLEIEDILKLKDGTRVLLTQIGTEWGEDYGAEGVCVKIGNRLVEADLIRPDDSSKWYPYYSIEELDDKGYECLVRME